MVRSRSRRSAWWPAEGDFLYIPAGMPHLARNLSSSEPCRALVARTDPDEQESVVLLPELEPDRQAA